MGRFESLAHRVAEDLARCESCSSAKVQVSPLVRSAERRENLVTADIECLECGHRRRFALTTGYSSNADPRHDVSQVVDRVNELLAEGETARA